MATASSIRLQTIKTPIKNVQAFAKALLLPIGNFFYGDDLRTKRSITFAYLSIMLYSLAVINAENLAGCAARF